MSPAPQRAAVLCVTTSHGLHRASRALRRDRSFPGARADDSVEMAIGFVTDVGALLRDNVSMALHQCAPSPRAKARTTGRPAFACCSRISFLTIATRASTSLHPHEVAPPRMRARTAAACGCAAGARI